MKKVVVIALALAWQAFGSCSRVESPRQPLVAAHAERVHADRAARESLLGLHFFSEGAGMHTSPGLVNLAGKPGEGGLDELPDPMPMAVESTYRHRWGFNVDYEGQPVGLFAYPYDDMTLGVLGCAVCHSGSAAGVFVPGLGNKNFDVLQVGKDLEPLQHAWKAWTDVWVDKSAEYRRLEASALAFASLLADEQKGNLTQGMVPVSMIRDWFYRSAGVPWPQSMPKGAVKVPALWGYGMKRSAGQFCDGFGDGSKPGWAVAVELVAGQRPDAVRRYVPKIDDAEQLMADLLPPPYPFEVDRAQAARGAVVFGRACTGCHGDYSTDDEGLPLYAPPKWIPWDVVQTDRDRIEGNTAEFRSLVANNPLSDLIQATSYGDGYFAPRLVGIWARFPYLHNASVPNLEALLTTPSRRPLAFSLRDAGEKDRFDRARVGLDVPPAGSPQEAALLKDGKKGRRDVYFVGRVGHSNLGHPFGTELSADQKADLIEHLKTL